MTSDDAKLIRRFVMTFERLDDLTAFHDTPPPNELSAGIDPDDWNFIRWRPAPLATPIEALSLLYDRIPGSLPRLYERLILSYRWLEVDLRICRLLANPPATDLQPLVDRMFADPVLNNTLIHSGFIRFALAPDACYDPICFDLNRSFDGDCPIVRFNHESILMHDSLGEAEQLFVSRLGPCGIGDRRPAIGHARLRALCKIAFRLRSSASIARVIESGVVQSRLRRRRPISNVRLA